MLENLKLGDRYDGFLFLAESARNPPVLKPHHHVELELNLVRRGTITYVVNGQRSRFSQGTLLWLFPAQEHQLVDRTDDAQYYVAVFKPGLIEHCCKAEMYGGLKRDNVEDGGILHADLDPGAFDLLNKVMAAMVADGLDPDILNREAGFGLNSDFVFEHGDPDGLNAGLSYLLLLCWRLQRGRDAPNQAVSLHPAVAKALKLIGVSGWEEDFGRLARRCGVSAAYLSRVFARQVGVSLSRYRNSVRLGRFMEIYRQPTQMNITEAVYAAGFGSYAQFYKVFTQVYGRSPRVHLDKRRRILALGQTLRHDDARQLVSHQEG